MSAPQPKLLSKKHAPREFSSARELEFVRIIFLHVVNILWQWQISPLNCCHDKSHKSNLSIMVMEELVLVVVVQEL